MTDRLTTDPALDARSEAFAERLIDVMTTGAEMLTIDLGRRLGLYESLAASGPATPALLAERAGIHERYAREWLEQQAAAGILEVARDGAAPDREYELPAAHAAALLESDHPLSVIGGIQLSTAMAFTLPDVADVYRTGEGVSYADYGADVRRGIAALNKPGFVHDLAGWLHTMPDIAERLRAGGSVLDAGCGVGWSTIAIARAFPAAGVVGVDMDTASIAEARENADAARIGDRLTFREANTSDDAELRAAGAVGFDLVTVFEALHDMGEPILALAEFRELLAPGGAVLVADERVADTFEAPAGDIERLQYAASVLHCLPATMAESTAIANGTVLRAPTVRDWARRAGFASATELPVDHLFWRFYRLDP